MPIPPFQDCFLPFLKRIGDGNVHSTKDIANQLAEHFNLTQEEKNIRLKSGQRMFENRVAWTRVHFKGALVIENPERGKVKITERGLELLQKNPETLNCKSLRQYPEYNDFISGKSIIDPPDPTPEKIPEEIPEEIIEKNHNLLRKQLTEELLSQLSEKDPAFFERLVVKLLVKMGYGGSLDDASRAIGHSGDGGIDGIIKEDKLGLDVIYLQAKRWKDTTVGRPEIQKFVGALAGHGAKKGVFITTSRFSQEARQYRPHNDMKVVLIDGEELAQLMIDYDLGVTTEMSFEIKRIDNDFFDEV